MKLYFHMYVQLSVIHELNRTLFKNLSGYENRDKHISCVIYQFGERKPQINNAEQRSPFPSPNV